MSALSEVMRARPVGDFINNVKLEGPDCLVPPKPRTAQLGFAF
jgi:hypothetical protein